MISYMVVSTVEKKIQHGNGDWRTGVCGYYRL